MKYEKYKPSGIDWIGDFPNQWQFRRLKNVCSVNKDVLTEKTPFDYLIEYIDIGNTNDKGEFLELQEIEFSEAPSRARRKVEDGDTIISTVRTYLRAIAFIEKPKENLIVSTGFAVLSANKTILLPKFLFYQVLCDSFIQRVIANSEGVSYPAISSTKLADLKLFIPSVGEQRAIASYLDDQMQKIDRLIANKKAQAEKLKELRQIEINNAVTKGLNPKAEMKDSGIDWLGNIPKHWSVKHLKRAFNFYNNIRVPLSSEERADLENIYDYYGASGVIDKVDRYLFDGYYILVGEDGANLLDRSSPLAFKASGKFWVNNHAHIIKPIKGDIDFYTFFLESIDFTIYITGSAQPKLTIEALSGVRVVVPPPEEQIEITNYLRQRTLAIDKLMKNVDAQIEQLQELRKIKIYEAVTGKIKVNAYAEATA